MTCADSSVQLLLADYYTGELPLAEHTRVESHVAQCDECRGNLLLMESLSRRGSTARYARGHVAPEVLISYFRDAASFQAERSAEIRAHLDDCESCRTDFQFMSELRDELESTAERQTDPARQIASWHRWNWLTSPALAWLLVAAAAYPTLSWLKSRTSPEFLDPTAIAAGPWQPLIESRRGSGSESEVTRTDGSALVRLTVPQGTLPAEMDYRFTVLEESSDDAIPVEIISNMSERGRILLLLNTRGLSDGSYFLQVVETRRSSGSQESERGYRFRLVTSP